MHNTWFHISKEFILLILAINKKIGRTEICFLAVLSKQLNNNLFFIVIIYILTYVK